ncbi:hypothetical protein HJ144_19405, partial [Vibrio parahaemolyticus]|nr:hypothetical protein [Vibrio parahaemolyticus]
VMAPLAGGVASSSKVIEAMIIASKEERTLALDYFTKAISFTICSNQTKKNEHQRRDSGGVSPVEWFGIL